MRALTIATFNSAGLSRMGLWPDLLAELDGSVDVLAIQEATGAAAGGGALLHAAERVVTTAMVDRFGTGVGRMRGLYTPPLEGGPMGQLVLVRQPWMRVTAHWLAECSQVGGDKVGVIDAVVDESIPVRARGVHLPYSSGDARLGCVRTMTRYASDAAILLGDFNSMQPDDPNEPDWTKLPPHKRHHKAAWDGEKWVSDRRALAELTRAGFVSAAGLAGDWTATVNPGVDNGAEPVIDQILLSPALAAAIVPESYRVHVGECAEAASDHRMVSVVLDLDRVGAGA